VSCSILAADWHSVGERKQEMNTNNNGSGWTVIPPRSNRGGVYGKYKDRIVIVIPEEKNKDHLLITPAGYEALGKPDKVQLMQRGTNIAICDAGEAKGFKVSVPFHRTDDEVSMYYVSPSYWRRNSGIRPGVYEAHIENGMIVFDSAQMPSAI
jgi:hypothetical protein